MKLYYFIQLVEIQEAHDLQKCLLESPENIINICSLNKIWNNRKPWIGDNLSVWNDLVSWRQTYYSFLIQHNLNTNVFNIETAMVNILKYYLFITVK